VAGFWRGSRRVRRPARQERRPLHVLVRRGPARQSAPGRRLGPARRGQPGLARDARVACEPARERDRLGHADRAGRPRAGSSAPRLPALCLHEPGDRRRQEGSAGGPPRALHRALCALARPRSGRPPGDRRAVHWRCGRRRPRRGRRHGRTLPGDEGARLLAPARRRLQPAAALLDPDARPRPDVCCPDSAQLWPPAGALGGLPHVVYDAARRKEQRHRPRPRRADDPRRPQPKGDPLAGAVDAGWRDRG